MTDDTTSTELTERIAALGRHPVDPVTASQHLSAMAGVSLGRTGLRQKLQVAGALMAGIFIGGTGLATAGALGQSAEHRADKIVAAVTGQSDDKKADKADKSDDDNTANVETDGDNTDTASTDSGRTCPEGQNHGQGVRAAAQADGATGESVSTVAQDKEACAANPGDDSTSGTDADDTENAGKADNGGKGSEHSGQGTTKAADAQDKAADSRQAGSQNSGTGSDTGKVGTEDGQSGSRGSGRPAGGSGKGKAGSTTGAVVDAADGDDD